MIKKVFILILILLIISGVYFIVNSFFVKEPKENTISAELVTDNFYITKNSYIQNGVHLEMFIESELTPYLVINNIEYELIKAEENYYIDLDLTTLENGEYNIYIKTDKYYYLTTILDDLTKLNRTKLNDKLITFIYEEEIEKIKIENFNYAYDILIDVGHGGVDVGASNSTMYEKDLNLMVSLYEKERYIEHGLKVLLTREDDTYGITIENDEWTLIQKRSNAVGYYGVVSKIAYSNHTNSSYSKYDSGFELIVSNSVNVIGTPEKQIFDSIMSIYPVYLINNQFTLYSKDSITYERYDKTQGQVYSYIDYYAVIRVPKDIFNVNVSLYEHAYMSNSNNFYWYYNLENWKRISEIKIKYYVESLGIKYIER